MPRNNRRPIKDNESALAEASELQKRSLESLERSQAQAAEAQAVGATTLDELYAQRRKLDQIERENERVSNEIARTDRLQNKLGRWAFDFGGKKVAKKHVALDRKNERELEQYKDDDKPDKDDSKKIQPASSRETEVISKRKKSGFRSKGKKKPVSPPRKRELLDGIDINNKDNKAYRKELEELNAGDKQLDDGLNALGSQLDSLVTMSKAIGEETQSQQPRITDTVQQVEANNEAQAVNAVRLGRFFTGGRRQQRKEADKASMLGPMVGMKTKAAAAAVGL